MTIMLSAGEASGDLHASELIKELRRQRPQLKFCFLGGDLMAAAAECNPAVHYKDMAYMGFVDVIRHLPQVTNNLRIATSMLAKVQPDALVLVDYPSFNLRLAQKAKELGIATYYYISPKVWAWKEFRTRQIAGLCDMVFGIFPFEPDFYASHGYDRCIYVGNPSVEEIDRRLAKAPSMEQFVETNGLDKRPIIAVVPGSRLSEIRSNMPIMLEAARVLSSKYQAVIAGAPGIDASIYNAGGVPVIFGQTTDLMHASTAALVTSGTASLEAALAGVPQVVCYRHNGSKVFYGAMSKVLKIPYVSLPNLVAGHEVVPELLLHKCTPLEVLRRLVQILPGHTRREPQLQGYKEIRAKLGTTHAAATAARLILRERI